MNPTDLLLAMQREVIMILTTFAAATANIAVSVERIGAWRCARLVPWQSCYCCRSSIVATLLFPSRARPP